MVSVSVNVSMKKMYINLIIKIKHYLHGPKMEYYITMSKRTTKAIYCRKFLIQRGIYINPLVVHIKGTLGLRDHITGFSKTYQNITNVLP